MWKVSGTIVHGSFDDLDVALQCASEIREQVTITGNGVEIVGKFGVDSVKHGILPSGEEYTWKKRR